MSLETEQVLHCIMCHLVPLGVHLLGSTTKGRKGLISYKTENATSAMKKHYEGEHFNIWKVYVSEISFWCSIETNPSKKLNSKVWKMVTLSSISTFFGNTAFYKTSQEEQKAFIDDLVLLVMKEILFLSMVESIWINLLTFNWEPKHVTIGLIDTNKTSRVNLASQLQDLFEGYELTNKVICCMKDEGTNLSTWTNVLK